MAYRTISNKKIVQSRLFSWYQKEKRALPWRKTKDPYKIWASEIMLQQTQVQTVIPYYNRWIKALPTIQALAKAPLSSVLKLWEGLGYYRRARMLHQAARHIVKNLDGKLPNTVTELRKLPGVGRYTAGAIASIAFNQKAPVLDGNVIRVLTRLCAIKKSVDRPAAIEKLWEIAESLLPKRSIGDFNQALMELGATICFPQNPDCDLCCLRAICKAHRQGREMMFPIRTQNGRYEDLTMYALVLQNKKGEIFLKKQPSGHWWAGLWTFPFWSSRKEFFSALGKTRNLTFLGTIQHGVTKFKISLRVFRKNLKNARLFPGKGQGRWVRVAGLEKLAIPSPHRKIAGFLTHAR